MALTSIAFLLAFSAGCALAFVRHPIYGLVTYVAVFYLHPPSRWWGEGLPDIRWSLVAAAVTLVALLLRRKAVITPPLLQHGVIRGLVVFVLYVAVQTYWAMDFEMHMVLLTIMVKYLLLIALIYKCIDSEKHLKLFLWSHVLGCLYFGWLAYTTYSGGRFESFGGPESEANSGALQVATGIFVASALFMAGKLRERIALLGAIVFIVNALITTISRSGFIAAGIGGAMFNYFTPRRLKWPVRVLSVLALVLFIMLSNPVYWSRIGSIMYAGDDVEGVDTGGGRLTLVEVQWRMFLDHPLGCGHRCTAVLSRAMLPDEMLTGEGDERARSSHNTLMTMLVEHGVLGATLYLMLSVWIFRTLLSLRAKLTDSQSLESLLLPAVAAILTAIIVGDLFVDYLKLEVRFWFVAILMVLVNMVAARETQTVTATQGDASPAQMAPISSPARSGATRQTQSSAGTRRS